MNMLSLILRSIKHAWLRSLLLLLCIIIAYTLFGTLLAFERAYSSSDLTSTNRMITVNKISFTEAMPLSHFRAVKRLESVGEASFATWFGGFYRERRNSLHAIAVDPQTYLAVYSDDLSLTEVEQDTFLQERGSILVGEAMARRFDWKVGDQIPIINPRLARLDGSTTWTFKIAGIFKAASAIVDTNFLYIHYNLVNEARASDQNTIGWIVTMPGAGHNPDDMGQAIDRLFETAPERTTTDTERSFSQIFVAQFGDLALVTIIILGAAFFSLLVIVASTTVLAIQQRAREVGIMKALGFSHLHIMSLLIGESLIVTISAGLTGLAAAAFLVHSASESLTLIAPGMSVSAWMIALGLASMIVLALAASALPAWRTVNLTTASVLRRG